MNHLSNGKIAVGAPGSKARLAQYDEPVEPIAEVGGEDNYVVFVKNSHFSGFALKFKCNGTFYYQHLMLSCRGGGPEALRAYFEAARRLYGHLRRDGELAFTTDTFKRLAV